MKSVGAAPDAEQEQTRPSSPSRVRFVVEGLISGGLTALPNRVPYWMQIIGLTALWLVILSLMHFVVPWIQRRRGAPPGGQIATWRLAVLGVASIGLVLLTSLLDGLPGGRYALAAVLAVALATGGPHLHDWLNVPQRPRPADRLPREV